MPATAAAYGLRDPTDASQAIDAQAHLMHDLLRQFGAVPLALAAYNAGPAPVQRCGCAPPYPETRGYVARILGLLGGAGEAPAGGGLTVRLIPVGKRRPTSRRLTSGQVGVVGADRREHIEHRLVAERVRGVRDPGRRCRSSPADTR